jgi:hypothetical protein
MASKKLELTYKPPTTYPFVFVALKMLVVPLFVSSNSGVYELVDGLILVIDARRDQKQLLLLFVFYKVFCGRHSGRGLFPKSELSSMKNTCCAAVCDWSEFSRKRMPENLRNGRGAPSAPPIPTEQKQCLARPSESLNNCGLMSPTDPRAKSKNYESSKISKLNLGIIS